MSSIISDFDRRRATAGDVERKNSSIIDAGEEGTTQASGHRTPGALIYMNERVSSQPNTPLPAGGNAWGELTNHNNLNNDDVQQ